LWDSREFQDGSLQQLCRFGIDKKLFVGDDGGKEQGMIGIILFACLAFIGCDQPQFESVPQEFRGAWSREYSDNEETPCQEELQITENSYKSTRYEEEGAGGSYVKKNETTYSASWFKGQLILERNNNHRIIYYDPIVDVENGKLTLDKRSSVSYTRPIQE
jgi:hypothetical protein